MSLRRLYKSIAWKLLPYAELETRTPGGLRLPVRDKGEWSCLSEIFVERAYDPFWRHLAGVRGWVDIGSNVGFFSLGMLEFLTSQEGRCPPTRAFLGDANESCVAQARETIRLNGLAQNWVCEHLVVGPPGETVTFSQFRYSVHSSIVSPQRGEKTFHYQTTDLAALLARLRGVFDLVKIDIEGAEQFLFEHHTDLLKRFRFGLCEWHAPHFKGAALRDAIQRLGGTVLEMRSQAAEGYDMRCGHSWESPLGTALWRNPAPAG